MLLSEKTALFLYCLICCSLTMEQAEAKGKYGKEGVSHFRQPNGAEKRKRIEFILNKHESTIRRESRENNISAPILTGLVAQESAGDSGAISRDGKNSHGLTQTRTIVDKATGVNCNSFESSCSIKKGAAYLKHLKNVEHFRTEEEMLLGYNREPSKARKYKGNPGSNYYVKQVKSYATIAEDILYKNAKKESEQKQAVEAKKRRRELLNDEQNKRIVQDIIRLRLILRSEK